MLAVRFTTLVVSSFSLLTSLSGCSAAVADHRAGAGTAATSKSSSEPAATTSFKTTGSALALAQYSNLGDCEYAIRNEPNAYCYPVSNDPTPAPATPTVPVVPPVPANILALFQSLENMAAYLNVVETSGSTAQILAAKLLNREIQIVATEVTALYPNLQPGTPLTPAPGATINQLLLATAGELSAAVAYAGPGQPSLSLMLAVFGSGLQSLMLD